MNTPQTRVRTLKLIDGTFSPDQAREILGAMVRHKIDYHRREQFSHNERFGKVPALSEDRLRNLRVLENELREILEEAEASGKTLRVRSLIEITFDE